VFLRLLLTPQRKEILLLEPLIGIFFKKKNPFVLFLLKREKKRMAPEVIACDKDDAAVYDEKVHFFSFSFSSFSFLNKQQSIENHCIKKKKK